ASQNAVSRMRRRSGASLTMLRSRGSIRLNQTSQSKRSKRSDRQSAPAMACWMMARSSGSRWAWTPCADAPGARPASSSAALSRAAQAAQDFRNDVIDGDLGGLAAAPLPVFEPAGRQSAVTDDDAVGNAQQLGVGELDAGPGVAVVVQHVDAGS